LADLPSFLRPVSFALPLTYGADILKTAINQNGVISILLSFIALLGFSVFLFAYSIYNVNRKWIL
jgi:ABC-2 type transport system permease protein